MVSLSNYCIWCLFLYIYNHGQKSWDIFAFLGRFPMHTGSTPLPSPHKQCWTRVSRIFSEFQLCIGWGRENCKKISKRMHCFKREPRNDRKIWILQTLKRGVPQGTKLGVILFTVMTNKLLSDWRLRIKYVDDTSALEIIPRNSLAYLM